MADAANGGEVEGSTQPAAQGPPRVFISYTHETLDHKRWVANLASDLTRNGVVVELDQWVVDLGHDVTLFMETGIRQADRVLVIATPTYKQKAEEAKGGVGYERLVITKELSEQLSTSKFIGILREGDDKLSMPIFMGRRIFADFRDDASYSASLDDLLRSIHKAPRLQPPPLGQNPFIGMPRVEAAIAFSHAELGSITAADDPELTFSKSERLLRSQDLIGWNRLVRATRQQFRNQLSEWRAGSDQSAADRERWSDMRNRAIDLIAPLCTLAMSAVDSGLPALADQRGLLADFVQIPQWNPSGYNNVVSMPLACGMVYHHILGAHYAARRELLRAIRLLQVRVSEVHSGITRVMDSSELMGWVNAVDHNCRIAWDLMVGLFKRWTWLSHLFPTHHDYLEALRAYNLIGSLLELGEFVRKNPNADSWEPRFRFQVPPMFLISGSRGSTLGDILSLVLPDQASTAELATACDIKPTLLRNAWRPWVSRAAASHDDMIIRISMKDPPDLP